MDARVFVLITHLGFLSISLLMTMFTTVGGVGWKGGNGQLWAWMFGIALMNV